MGFYYIDMSEHFKEGFHFALINEESLTPDMLNTCYKKHAWLKASEEPMGGWQNPNFYQHINPSEPQKINGTVRKLLESFKNPNARGYGNWWDVLSAQRNYRSEINGYLGLSTIAKTFEKKVSARFSQLGTRVGGSSYSGFKFNASASNEILAPIYHIGTTNGRSENIRHLNAEERAEVKGILSKLGYKEKLVNEFEKAYKKEFRSAGFFGRNPFSTMYLKMLFKGTPTRDELEKYASNYSKTRTAKVLAEVKAKLCVAEDSSLETPTFTPN